MFNVYKLSVKHNYLTYFQKNQQQLGQAPVCYKTNNATIGLRKSLRSIYSVGVEREKTFANIPPS